jgi:hypothetical protein
MQSISIHEASKLPLDVKAAVEQLLGRPIHAGEEVTGVASPPQQSAPAPKRTAIARTLQRFLDRRAEEVRDISDEEIDAAIDEEVKRARHSRAS